MKVLVTGASGFIGQNVCRALVARGHAVRAALRQAPGAPLGAQTEATVVGDIHAGTDWRTAVEGVDAIVHLAGRAHLVGREASGAAEAFRRVNVDGALALVQAARSGGVPRLVNVSSIGVLGQSTGEAPFTEATAPRPANAYARSKLEAEHALAAAAGDVEIVTVRPPLVYGPGGPGNMLRLLKLARSGVPLPLGLARGERDMIGIDNLVDILVLCVERPGLAGQPFVVCDGEPVSTAQLTRMLRRRLGLPPRLLPVPYAPLAALAALGGRAGEVARLFQPLRVDDSKFRREAGWTPRVSLAAGLDQTVAWFRGL